MSIYSEVLELLQVKDGLSYGKVKEKLGYNFFQIIASNNTFVGYHKRGDLYIFDIFTYTFKITEEGRKYDTSKAHLTRSDVGIKKDGVAKPGQSHKKLMIPVVGASKIRLAINACHLIASGIIGFDSIVGVLKEKPTDIQQAITVFNLRYGNGANLIQSEVKTGSRKVYYSLKANCREVVKKLEQDESIMGSG